MAVQVWFDLHRNINRSVGILFGLFPSALGRSDETAHKLWVGLERIVAGENRHSHDIGAVIGEPQRMGLNAPVFKQEKLVISPAEQAVRAFFKHRNHLRCGIDLHKIHLADVNLVVCRQGLEQTTNGVARRHGQRLAFDILGRTNTAGGSRYDRKAGRTQDIHHRFDLAAFGDQVDDAGTVRKAEGIGAGTDNLNRIGRASALIDGQVDAFLLVKAFVHTKIKRHMQPTDVPVKSQ